MTRQDRIWIRSMELCSKYCSCHQKPERSFFIHGYQFPLCARCTGIALGHTIALFIAPFHSFGYHLTVLLFPLAVDGTLQHLTDYESTNRKRVITGFLYGFAFTSIFFHTIRVFIKELKANKNE